MTLKKCLTMQQTKPQSNCPMYLKECKALLKGRLILPPTLQIPFKVSCCPATLCCSTVDDEEQAGARMCTHAAVPSGNLHQKLIPSTQLYGVFVIAVAEHCSFEEAC